MIGLLGKKVGMTQTFSEDGQQIPVTLLEVGPCYVTGIRTKDKHGYSAVQIGYQEVKEKKLNNPERGNFKKIKTPLLKYLREVRTEETEGLSVGSELNVDHFEAGDYVDVQGVSIGRGFQGVVKRHHFKGGEAAHGAKFGREAGSIGVGSAYPSRVPKGRKMAGQLGNAVVTVQNLKIMSVDPANRIMTVWGAVPGVEDGVLMIKTALKRGKARKWCVKAEEEKKEGGEGKTEKAEKGEAVKESPKEAPKEAAKAAVKEAPKESPKEAPKVSAKEPVAEKKPKKEEKS